MSSLDWAAESSEEEDEDQAVISPEKTDPTSHENNDDDVSSMNKNDISTSALGDEGIDNGSSQGDYNDQQKNDAPAMSRRRKPVVFPENPPYTAFVGNLAFSVQDAKVFADAISDLVRTRFGDEIVITAQRVAVDRQDGNRHKGFGYIEVETLEHLKSVLKLDDGKSSIAGRIIHLDVAQPSNNSLTRQPSRTSSFTGGSNDTAIDGSKFQGGRYNRQSSKTYRRRDSSDSVRSSGSNHNIAVSATTTSAVNNSGERPTLKLQPRGLSDNSLSSASLAVSGLQRTPSNTIFGGAKPRDEEAWERRNTDSNRSRPLASTQTSRQRSDGQGESTVTNARNAPKEKFQDRKPVQRQRSKVETQQPQSQTFSTSKKIELPKKKPPAVSETNNKSTGKNDVSKSITYGNKFAALVFDSDDD